MSEELQQTPEVQTEQPAPQLTLADLSLVLQTIQVVSQRGAIKAEEMETVGGLYTRLFNFLSAQGAIAQQPAPADETAPVETPAPADDSTTGE